MLCRCSFVVGDTDEKGERYKCVCVCVFQGMDSSGRLVPRSEGMEGEYGRCIRGNLWDLHYDICYYTAKDGTLLTFPSCVVCVRGKNTFNVYRLTFHVYLFLSLSLCVTL